jgi:hypothetical protein
LPNVGPYKYDVKISGFTRSSTHTHTHIYIYIYIYIYTGCPGERYKKIHAYVLVPKSFMKVMFSTVYIVTQKYFYARPYTFCVTSYSVENINLIKLLGT